MAEPRSYNDNQTVTETTEIIVGTPQSHIILFIAIIIIILIIFLLSENTNNPIFKQIMEVIKKVNMIVALPTFLIAAIAVFEMSRPPDFVQSGFIQG